MNPLMSPSTSHVPSSSASWSGIPPKRLILLGHWVRFVSLQGSQSCLLPYMDLALCALEDKVGEFFFSRRIVALTPLSFAILLRGKWTLSQSKTRRTEG